MAVVVFYAVVMSLGIDFEDVTSPLAFAADLLVLNVVGDRGSHRGRRASVYAGECESCGTLAGSFTDISRPVSRHGQHSSHLHIRLYQLPGPVRGPIHVLARIGRYPGSRHASPQFASPSPGCPSQSECELCELRRNTAHVLGRHIAPVPVRRPSFRACLGALVCSPIFGPVEE